MTTFTISFLMSVRAEHLDSHWTDFMEIHIEYFSKLYRENSSFIQIYQE